MAVGFQGATLIEPDVRISRIRLCASECKKHLPSTTATSAYGYKPPWWGLVETQPSPQELHALIGSEFCLAYGGS